MTHVTASWETSPVDTGDDVMLPRDLEDLERQFPQANASTGERASWLLRKASIYTRLAVTLHGSPIAAEVTREAAETRRAGLALQEQLLMGLRDRLRLDVESTPDHRAEPRPGVERLAPRNERTVA